MSDDVRLELLGAQVYRAGDFEQRRRLKFYVCHRFTNAESIEECFQIKSAVNLEFGGIAFSIPIAATGESAFVRRSIHNARYPTAGCSIQPRRRDY